MVAYDCHCPGNYPCPKFKGVASEIPGDENALRVITKTGTGKRGALFYAVEYHADLHFRNDGNDGNTPMDVIVVYKPNASFACDGLHMTQLMAEEIVQEINDALALSAAALAEDESPVPSGEAALRINNFAIQNHQNGRYADYETWTRRGIKDIATKIEAELAKFP